MRKRFYKRISQLKVPFSFDFHLSSNIGTWNTNLDFFDPFLGWWPHQGGKGESDSERLLSKMKFSPQVFLYCWISSSFIEILTSMFHQIFILIFPSLSTQDIQLWALFTQFGNNDITKGINILNFWNIN